jgi:hypothetical protein
MSKAMQITVTPIETIVPYWRNPRENTLAIEKVRESIALYGFQQPIIVDKKNMIIAGHTRYAAAKLLGFTELPVVITDMPEKKAKEFRIVDNRTSEYATWSDDLILELKEFADTTVLSTFFPNIAIDTDFGNLIDPVTAGQLDRIQGRLDTEFTDDSTARANTERVELICPHCTETFTITRGDLDKELTKSGS